MKKFQWAPRGFTIVELLIVIVVIAILAAITIVSFNGVQDRAKAARVTSMATQASKKIQLYYTENNNYPVDLSVVGVSSAGLVSYDYRIVQGGKSYCVAAVQDGIAFSVHNMAAPVQGDCGQVQVSYYNSSNLTGTPVYQTYEDAINFDWGAGSPKQGVVNNDTFSARWTGYIIPPESGTYTFYSYVDDYAKLYIDGNLVVNATTWSEFSGTIDLVANKPVLMVFETRENGGGALARLSWSYGSQAKTIIPAAAYNRTN